MAPHSNDLAAAAAGDPIKDTKASNRVNGAAHSESRKPMRLIGVLDQFKSFHLTPVIGREFPDASLAEWIQAPNSDELLRDLAITISQRGVVFFRSQDDMTDALQKELVRHLGELTGKPSSSQLHIHPTSNSSRPMGGDDDEISIISSVQSKTLYKDQYDRERTRQNSDALWHSDVTFEPVPPDYATLRMTKLPRNGGGESLPPTPM